MNYKKLITAKDEKSKKGKTHQTVFLKKEIESMFGEVYRSNNPFKVKRKVVIMDEATKELVNRLIMKAHREEDKIEVKKCGTIRNEEGYSVDAFCFEMGRFSIGTNLYAGMAVYRPAEQDTLHLLLVRSDQVQSKENNLFPELGTSKDWAVMRKCAVRHSPKWASRLTVIDIPAAQSKSAEANAAATLESFGGLNGTSLEVLGGMSAAKLHFLDLCCIAALYQAFPPALHPELVHTLVIRSNDDLDEVRRAARVWDLTTPHEGFGGEFPIIELTQAADLTAFKQADRFVLMTYAASEIALKVIGEVDRLRATSQGTGEFVKVFPTPPVLVGSSIWSKRACTEIDFRDVRFENRELEVGRVLIAELVQKRDRLVEALRMEWEAFSRHPEFLQKSPVRAWFSCFHYAAAAVLFPAYFSRAELLEIFKDADAARLRLREDRETRYKRAMDEIREATAETPWLEPNKPKTKAEAEKLLAGEKEAFLYFPQGAPSLCFTRASLRRLGDLSEEELNDFVAKLQRNKFDVIPSHPVTFEKGRQLRVIRIRADWITLTKSGGAGDELTY